MWYKFNQETNEWYIGNKVEFPNGMVLENNHENSIDGWFWSDEEPEEFTNFNQNEEN